MRTSKLLSLILASSVATSGFSTAAVINFESPDYTIGAIGATSGSTTTAPFTGQQNWSLSTASGGGAVFAAPTSGEYVEGQALSAKTTGPGAPTYIGGKTGIIDTSTTSTISFDFRFQTNRTVTAGFLADAGNNNLFDTTDTGMQFGVGGNVVYVREASFGAQVTLTGITNSILTAGNWYHMGVSVGEVVGLDRSLTLSVRDLTLGADVDLNGAGAGNAYTFSVADSVFGVAPEEAVGGFVTIVQAGTDATTRSAIDNLALTAVPEPSTVLLGGLGVLSLLVRRRRA